jgi:hypothetical protein
MTADDLLPESTRLKPPRDSVRCMYARVKLREIAQEYDKESDIGKALQAAILSVEVAWTLIEAIEAARAGDLSNAVFGV